MNSLEKIQEIIEQSEWSIAILLVVALWTLFWKGAALWHAARKKEKFWFVGLLLINTLGILEIVYLLIFRKQGVKDLYK